MDKETFLERRGLDLAILLIVVIFTAALAFISGSWYGGSGVQAQADEKNHQNSLTIHKLAIERSHILNELERVSGKIYQIDYNRDEVGRATVKLTAN